MGEVGAVGEEEIGETVVVVVDPGDAGAEGLYHQLLFGGTAFVFEADAGFAGNVDELDRRLNRNGDGDNG